MKNKQIIALQILLGLKALAWTVFSVLIHFIINSGEFYGILILSILMLGNAAIFALLAWKIKTRKKLWIYLALFWTLLNLILTFTDEFGIYDFLILLPDLPILVLLFLNKKPAHKARKKVHGEVS